MSKIVLVVAAHSDDEALGCSGTMAKHIAAGDQVHILFMTDGVSSRNSTTSEATKRLTLAKKVSATLGVASIENLCFPDNKMDAVPLLDITQAIEQKIKKLQANIIYTHHIGDLNVDHQITHKAVMTACRPQPAFSVKEIYAFEILSSTEWQTAGVMPFTPNIFIDISDYIDIKQQVLEIYAEEMRSQPHSRSIQNIINLAGVRGNAVGINYAEAFILLRGIR